MHFELNYMLTEVKFQKQEERDKKDDAMKNLQQKLKTIEEEHQNVKRSIEKLDEELEKLTLRGSTCSQELNTPHLSVDQLQPNNKSLRNKTKDEPVDHVPQLPRFMRPTICSRRKSGADYKNSEEKHKFISQRRGSLSHRAESVNFPVNGNSLYSSECSKSRNSCLLPLTMKGSADIETEYSQEASECDTKVVVFPEQDTSPGSSINQTTHLSLSEGYGKRLKNKYSSEFLRVDNWLHLPKNESSVITPHGGRRVLPIPSPEKKYRSDGRMKDSKLRDEKIDNCVHKTKEMVYHAKLERQADKGFRMSTLEDILHKPQTLLEDSLPKDSRAGSSCPLHTIDGNLATQTRDLVHVPSIMDSKCVTSFPPNICGHTFYPDREDNGVHLMSMIQAVKGETRCSDGFLSKNIGCCHFFPSDLDSIASSKEESGVSCSSLEQEPHFWPVGAGLGVGDSIKEDLETSSQSWKQGRRPGLQTLRFQIASFMADPNPNGRITSYMKSQEYPQNKGKKLKSYINAAVLLTHSLFLKQHPKI